MSLFHAGTQPALDDNGNPISGATWSFYVTETTTPATVYANNALSSSLGSSETSDAAGNFVDIYLDDSVTYRAILRDSLGATRKDIDPANPGADAGEPDYPVLDGEVGAFNLEYPVGDSRRYGVFPDGPNGTNWEGTTEFLNNMLRTGVAGHKLYFRKHNGNGLYDTGWNTSNRYGYDQLTIEFEEGTEFSGILHFISSATPAFHVEPTAISVGATTTITVSGGHGMSVGHPRYITFTGTDMAALDGQEVLATPTSSTVCTVPADTTGQTWSGSGEFNDVPLRNVTIKGTATTYDRFGAIAGEGWHVERIHCKSDATINYVGDRGRGVHIYVGVDNCYFGEIVVDDMGPQSESPTNHAAVAFDGPGTEPRNNYVGRIWVKDSANAAFISNGTIHVGQLIVDRFGWGEPAGTLTSTPPTMSGTDPLSNPCADIFGAVLLLRASTRIDHCVINQKDGYGAGAPLTRAFAFYGVIVEGTFIRWDDGSTFENEKKGSSIGHLEVGDILGCAVAVGAFGQAADLHIGRFDGGVIQDTSGLVTTPSITVAAGLVWCVHGRLSWDHMAFGNTNIATGLKVESQSDASFVGGSVIVYMQEGNAVWLRGSGTVESVSVLDNSGSSTDYPVRVDGSSSQSASIGKLRGRSTSTANRPFALFAPVEGHLGNFNISGYAPTTAGTYALTFGNNGANRVHCTEGGYITKSGGASGNGIKFDGTQDSQMFGLKVTNFAQGVGVGNVNSRLACVGCVSTGNTDNTTLTDAEVVTDTIPMNVTWSEP